MMKMPLSYFLTVIVMMGTGHLAAMVRMMMAAPMLRSAFPLALSHAMST